MDARRNETQSGERGEPPAASPLSGPEAWNLVAGAYVTDLVPMFERFAADALRLAGVAAGQQVVDVATGPGTVAMLAAEAGATVAALDFSAGMLVELEHRIRGTAAGKRIEVHQGDGQRLPFDTGRFDAGLSMFGLMFFPDRAAGFRELLRVLRPGGRAVVGSWAPFGGAFGLVMQSLRVALPEIPFGADVMPLSDPDTFAAEMRAAGFAQVAIHSSVQEMPLPTTRSFWESCERASAPVVLLRRKLGEARWRQASAVMLELLTAKLGPGPVSDSGHAHLGVGIKP